MRQGTKEENNGRYARAIVLMGTIKNYEGYLGDPKTFSAIPVTNMRTNFIFEM